MQPANAEGGRGARRAIPGSVWKEYYGPEELLEVACPMCQDDRAKELAREFGISIARCLRCQLVYTRTPLVHSQDHYDVSSEGALKKYGPIFRAECRHPRDNNYDEHLQVLEALAPPGDLLDVGSHAGFFLRRARERGWHTYGVEPSAATSQLAREQLGLDVRTGSLFDATFPSSSFDVVTLVDVLEHVAEPRQLLAEIGRVLRPGGRVFIKVPNVRYVLAKHYLLGRLPRVIEDVFDAREHLAYYSHKTLTSLLGLSGFEVELLAVPSPIQTGGVLRRALRRVGTAVAKRLPLGVALPLATDILAVGRKAIVSPGARRGCLAGR